MSTVQILFVDDEALIVAAAKEWLEEGGFTVQPRDS
jgi:CheY-like chemotaxis protein